MTAVTQIQMLLKYKYKYNDRGQPSAVQMQNAKCPQSSEQAQQGRFSKHHK